MMNIALITNKNQIASLRPGAEIIIESENKKTLKNPITMKAGTYPLVWSQSLKRHNVNYLLCSGVERYMLPTIKGILRHCGIKLVPEMSGSVNEVLWLWRSGKLILPDTFGSEGQPDDVVRKLA